MFSGFLRSAATTAAGVVAGEVAFSALSGLFGQHSGGGFLGGAEADSWGKFGCLARSETIINNYYGAEAPDQSSTPAAASLMGSDAENGVDDTTAADDSEESDDASYDDSTDDSSADASGSYDDNSGGGDSFDI